MPDRKEVSTEAALIAAFEGHRDRGYRQIILASDEGGGLSAVGEGFGPYTLEWFPKPITGTHFRAAGAFKSDEVLTALLADFRGDEDLAGLSAWQEVEDDRPPLPARIVAGLLGWFRGRGRGDDRPGDPTA